MNCLIEIIISDDDQTRNRSLESVCAGATVDRAGAKDFLRTLEPAGLSGIVSR